jgi:hypothetical protein
MQIQYFMNNFTQNFYKKKGKGTVNRWLTTLCLTVAVCMGFAGQVSAQTLVTAYQTQISTAYGWTTNASTGTSSSVNYSQNGCVMGGGGSMTINTATIRCTTNTGEIGMAGSLRWVDIPLIAFTNNSGGTSAGTITVTWFNNGGGRTLNYGIYNSQGLALATQTASFTPGTNNTCTTASSTLPAITGNKVLKISTNGNCGLLAIKVETYQSCTAPNLTYNLTGGTSICSGGSATLGLSNSETSVSYQLYNGAATVGSAVAGTGSAISFAAVSPTTNTTYSVKAKGTGGAYCTTETAAFASTAAVTMKSVSVAPVVSSPIIGGATFVSGTSTEADGTVIEVFVDGTSAGTTTVTSGNWSATVAALTLGNLVTAKATAPGKCLSAISNSVTVSTSCTAPTFSTQPTNNQSVCLNAIAPTLGTVVADQSPTYQWYVVGTQTNTGGTAVTMGTGGNTDTYTPASTTAGIYFYYCVATNGGCTTASNAVQFTVNAPTITLGANPSVINGATSANLTYSATTGTPTQYAIDWDATAQTAGLVDVALTTLPASPIVLNNIPATIATYSGTLTVQNAGGCISIIYPISVTVTAPVSLATDYFRSKTAGGAWATAGTWESSADGTTNWVTATATPTASAKGIEIQVNSTVTVGANLTTPVPTVNNTIQVNGTLTVDSTFKMTLGGNMLVGSIGTLILTGTTAASLVTTGKVLTVLGVLSNGNSSTTAITTAVGELIFANGAGAGKYEITVAATSVQVPVATWVNGTNYSTIAFKNGSAALVPVWNNNTTAILGDIEINSTSITLYRPFGTVSGSAFTMRNLTVISTGTGGVQFFGGTNTSSLNLSGNYTQNADVVTLAYANANITFNVAGNFSVASSATFKITGGTGTINFNGTIPQTFSNAGTISGAIGISVATGASVSIGAGQNIPVGSLTLGGVAQTSGSTYGGTGSNARTINSTYFAATTGTVSVGPSISFTGTLANVDTTYGTASPTPASFSISGVNMTAGILVTPPSGYEVSLTLGSGYGSTVTAGAAGTIASTPIYLRLSASTAAGSYSGNVVLSSASALSRNVATVSSVVNKADQTITFEALAPKTFGDASYALTGTASSGLGVTYTSSDLNVAIVSGSTVTIVGAGTTTITASQVGNANYNPAPDATQTLTVAPANSWIGGTGNWNTAGNWSLGNVPSNTDNIIISSGSPALDTNFTLASGRSLSISGAGTLTINPTSVLTLSGTANFGGRSVVLKSDATGTGTIGQVTGTLTGATNVTAERYIPSGKRAFRFLTPSVTTSGTIFANWQNNGATTAGIGIQITGSTTGANGFDTTASGSPSMYTYQNTVASGTGWLAIPSTNSTSLVAGMGYRTLIRGDRNVNIAIASADNMNVATTLSATGTLKVGNVVFDSASTPALNNTISTTSNPTTNDYSLIGNPYASPVDWELVSRTNVADFYYTWDPNMGTTTERGRYVAYSASSHTATNSGSGTSYVNRYIQPGQAIFVKTIGSNPSLTFKEEDKNATFTNVFRTTTNSTLSVSVYNPSEVAFAAPIDGTIAVFGTDFNASVGIGDVVKMYSAGEHLAWSKDTKLLAIDATIPVVANDQLLLKTMQFAANKSYTFKVSATNFDTSLTGYLVDQYLNSQTQLDFNTANFITFATTTDVNSYGSDRFKVVFSPSVLNTNVWNESTVHIYPNPVTNNQFAISVPSLTNGKVTVTIHNLIGQSVYKESISAINSTIVVRPLALLKAGVYSVAIENEGKRSTQKIIVK